MEKESSYGPVIGLVIIIVIIALGSVYFLQERENAEVVETTTTETAQAENTPVEQEAAVDTINELSSEDTLDSIIEDLDSTDLDSLEAEFDDLEL
jgi:hypothetical protein